MPTPNLTKSDFKACFDCRTKLYYRKKSYPTNLDETEYLQFLADGGFMIETVAKAQYPCGIDLADERDPQRAFSRPRELIGANPEAVVFEAAVIWEKYPADHAHIQVVERLHGIVDTGDHGMRGASYSRRFEGRMLCKSSHRHHAPSSASTF